MLFNIKNKHKKSGFTIIELIVVMVVIGILAALVVVAYNGVVLKSKESALASDMSNARKSLEMYNIEHGYYPDLNDCSVPEDSRFICLKTSPNNVIDYQSDGETYTIYGSIIDYDVFYKASNELMAKKFTGWRQISEGSNHTCGIYYNGKVYCWGSGGSGQLGNGESFDVNKPSAVRSDSTSDALYKIRLKTISSGVSSTCAIAYNNKIYCWGGNDYGQLGDDSKTPSFIPKLINEEKDYKSISVGFYHTCAIDLDSKVYCWGRNYNGQLGNNSNTDSFVPVAVKSDSNTDALYSKKIKSISTGQRNTCAIDSDGRAYCWGNNEQGQLGNGSLTYNSFVPVAVKSDSDADNLYNKKVISISSDIYSGRYNCAVASDKRIYCWGNSTHFADSAISPYLERKPVPIATNAGNPLTNQDMNQVSGASSVCAITSQNKVYCWFSNESGQLGNNNIDSPNTPYLVKADNSSDVLYNKKIEKVYSGKNNHCAIDTDGQVYCWGEGSSGQLGDGKKSDSSVPVEVAKPESF